MAKAKKLVKRWQEDKNPVKVVKKGGKATKVPVEKK